MSETVIGGYYLSSDGKSAHDANGNPLPLVKPAEIVVEPILVESNVQEVEVVSPAPKAKTPKAK